MSVEHSFALSRSKGILDLSLCLSTIESLHPKELELTRESHAGNKKK